MERRFVSIWFPHLSTDWFALRRSVTSGHEIDLQQIPFVLRTSSHGRMIITAANAVAERRGISRGMVLADARAIVPELEVMDDKPDLAITLLRKIAEWCIRFTPAAAIDPPDGLLLDATGCSHLWKGDEFYLNDIVKKIRSRGYDVRVAMADTIGVAWGVARYGKDRAIINHTEHLETLMCLPPEGLRLESETIERLHKLGLHHVRQFIHMPRSSLRRRFGQHFLMRLDMALGQEMEMIEPVQPPEHFQERLPCLEPIITLTGIEIALLQLLEALCLRLQKDQKGIRKANFKGYRVDGKIEMVTIGTYLPSHNVGHLFKLFELKLSTIEPSLGIELFVLEAPKVEDHFSQQSAMWEESGGLGDTRISELIDRLANRIGARAIQRYLPQEHYWPERSYKAASSLHEKLITSWPNDKHRPLHLLNVPEPIEVTAPIPDYPPMLFRYLGKVHEITRADGPERIEQEWWVQQGQHRDYYRVEDHDGHRYWVFRLGHYDEKRFEWFIHGYFS